MSKPKRRVKASVRKTAGALFLATSIVVAAIPTGSLQGGKPQAANNCDGTGAQIAPADKYKLVQQNTDPDYDIVKCPVSNIPFVKSTYSDGGVNKDIPIFSTGTGDFQFAYVDSTGTYSPGSNEFAVILGYKGGYLQGGTLEIPNTVDVYKQLSDNNISQGNCLVNKSGGFLYYYTDETSTATYTVRMADKNTPIDDVEPFDNRYAPETYLNQDNPYSTSGHLYDMLRAIDTSYQYSVKSPNQIRINIESKGINEIKDDNNVVTEYEYYFNYKIYHVFFRPCLASDSNNWEGFRADELFYKDGSDFKLCDQDVFQKVEGIEVRYIGNQFVVEDTANGGYKLSADPIDDDHKQNGIFAGQKGANISTLITHENLAGVGDYAFYNCSALSSITFENGLVAIGNHAFDGCSALSNVYMPLSPKLQNIGAYAFRNCSSLSGFFIPHSVNLICDGVFYGCTNLTYMDLTGDLSSLTGAEDTSKLDDTGKKINTVDDQGTPVSVDLGTKSRLSNIGYHVFYGCTGLRKVIFPVSLGTGYNVNTPRKININILEDCSGLERVVVLSPYMTFADATDNINSTSETCGFNIGGAGDADGHLSFHKQLSSDEFCFEGVDPAGAQAPTMGIGALHKTLQEMDKDYEYTYKYFGEEVYERTVNEEGGGKAFYQVDSTNTLCGFDKTGTVKSLTFPEKFGPYHISEIGYQMCKDICTLETVTLPSTIDIIGEGAFKGCHNLKFVYFGNPNVVIRDEAFLTQVIVSDHMSGCTGYSSSGNPGKLFFVFNFDYDIETVEFTDFSPFNYAMSNRGVYSHPNQTKSYPTVISGFPSLLEISYNQDKDCAELVKFPTATTISTTAGDYLVNSNNPNKDTRAHSADGYLTIEQYDAIQHYITSGSANPTTAYDQEIKKRLETLVIPRGVQSIKDGLFSSRTGTNNMAVDSKGLTEIDVDYTKDGDGKPVLGANGMVQIDATKSDFAGCNTLTGISLTGDMTATIPDYGFYNCDGLKSVYSTQPIDSIGEQGFAECGALEEVEMYGVTSIGDHAFYNDDSLKTAKFDSSVNSLGLAPFRVDYYDRTTDTSGGHTSGLSNVDFQDNTRFKTDNGIIYSLDDGGAKNALIEFLPGRSAGTVQPGETKGVKAISQEAFADTRVNVVNLENAAFYTLPERAFEDTKDLVSVTLPQSCGLIDNYAFKGSNLRNLTVMNDNLDWKTHGLDLIRTTMGTPSNDSTDHGVSEDANKNLTVYAPAETDENGNVTDKSNAYEKFENHNYLVQAFAPIKHYYVTYYDYADANATKATLMFTEEYVDGDQVILRDPNMDADNKHSTPGFAFEHYYNLYDTEDTYDYRYSFNIHDDLTIVARYKGLNESYTAIFYDTDPDTGATGSVLMDNVPVLTQDDNGTTKYYINANQIAYLAPAAKTGYTFQTWQKIDPRDGVLFTLDQVEEKDGVIKFYAKYSSGSGGGGGQGGGTVGPGQYKVSYYLPDGSLYQVWGVDPGGTAYDIIVPNYSRTEWKWSPDIASTVINADTKFVLVPADGADPTASNKFTATYYYTDGVTVYQKLSIEKDATPPDLMMPSGYKQCKWSPDPSSTKMDKDMRFTMVKNPDYTGDDENYTGPYYTLTVVNGSGSGSYKPGAQVVISANDAKTGTVFSSWTVSPDSTPIASKAMSATVITMPSNPVTVTANYVASTSNKNGNGTGGTGSGTNNNNNNTKPTGGNVVRSSGTTVVIDKNGLSNTGVVSATVNGSSDNFTIKVTASQTADKAVLDALLKKYGSVDNLVYFPMDISLYDAAGTTQIHDTSGLTITITLPLPDSMVQYGANNQVGYVVNGELDGLNPKFTTINGVPCVTFTCTHFSPYVIYVNTVSMAAGSDNNPNAIDNTPKTADPIHPKWFVSIALFAISIVLFLMKDKKTVKAVAGNGSSIRKQK